MQRRLRFLSLLVLLSAAGRVTHANVTPTYRRDLWKTDAGFPGGYIYSITQTANGYIWIGSSKGLFRFDGLSFVPIRQNDSNADARFPVWNLLTDVSDQLWVLDDHTHVFRYSADHLVGPLSDKGSHRYRRSPLVAKTREGRLLFGSETQGLVEYDGDSARVLLDPAIMPNLPTAIAQTPDGAFWIGTEGTGLFRVSLKYGVPEIQNFPALSNIKINCLLPIRSSTLLIGTGKGLLTLHDGTLIHQVRTELGNQEIVALATGMRGDIWIGAEGRAFKVRAQDIGQDGQIRLLEGVPVNGAITALFEDRDGDLWIGGPEEIERYRGSGFVSYLSSAGLPCVNCGAIYADHHDRVWFAPWDGGLFRLWQGSVQTIEVAGLKHDTVYSIVGGADDEVWVGRKYGGVTRLTQRGDALEATTYTRKEGLAEDSVSSIYRARDGTIWAGMVSGGLSRLRGGTWRTFTTRDGLPSSRISVITGNEAGEIFVGTPMGLAALKNDHWVVYAAHDGLPPGTIESLFADDSGTLWIGTTKGVSFLRSGTVQVPLGAPKALYAEILGIAENDGWLWMATRDHVLRVRRTALLKQSFDDSDYREFGVADGLPSSEGVKRNGSVFRDNRRRIWFSLNQGISVLQPSAFVSQAFPVTTRLDEMLVDGRLLAQRGEIRVPAGQHRLTFRYAGVNVSNPGGVRYRYRLDGVDSAWSEPSTMREIDYTNVAPGRFRFHVMARNPDGIWSAEESTMPLEVEAAYWQTRWFQMVSGAVLVLLIFGLHRLRLQQLERQFNSGLEARVSERTRIARELHDTLLQGLHGLMFQFQAARNMLPRNPDRAKVAFDNAIGATEQAISESEDAIRDLRSESCMDSDLVQLLTSAAEELAALEAPIRIVPTFRVTEEGERQDLAPILQNEIYRVAREVLRNAFRHAEATRIEAEIRFDRRTFCLRIRDDGKGIDPQVLAEGGRPGHWGLPGVQERARRMQAKLDFWSAAGAGTEVQLSVPADVAYKKERSGGFFGLFRRMKSYENGSQPDSDSDSR
jgi:signal transduction histidine kinase/ligand-binding sensor domain-containing protein